jgi:nucleoside-diphosphate-sugar epimerase
MRTALVTGSSGFIGRHIVDHLVDDGWAVTPCDLQDVTPTDCRDFFASSDRTFDMAVHCAATVGGRARIDGDPLGVATNLALDAALFQWVRRTQPAHTVYFSSSAAYPVSLQAKGQHKDRLAENDIDLEHPQMPDQTYGLAKLTGEYLAAQAAADGHRIHVFRPFSGYGEDQSLDYPFPSFIARAANREDPFEVWGDGTQTRDWIHVDDIIGAVMAAVRYDIAGPVNLGWGEPVSMGELVMAICEQAGHVPETVDLRPDRPTGVWHRVADARKMLSFYAPTVPLEEGIARALAAHVAA